MRLSTALILALLTFPVVGATQATPAGSPEAVTSQIWAADSAGDWVALIRLAHPDALQRGRATALWSFNMLHSPLWDSLGRMFPMDSSRRRDLVITLREQENLQLRDVFGVSSVAELAGLPVDTFFARQFRYELASGRRRTVRPATMKGRVLGTVTSGDTLAVVVLAPPLQDTLVTRAVPITGLERPPLPERPETFVLRRWNGTWRGMIDVRPLGSGGLVPIRRAPQ